MGKQTIIVLHGWGLNGQKFSSLAETFRHRGYKVFNPDLPGFGSLGIPQKPLNLADYVEFLNDYLMKKEVHNAVFIGHSFGGRVALRFNQIHPDSVKALILTGTPGFTPIARKKLMLFIIAAKIGGLFFKMPPFNLVAGSVRKWYYYFVGAKDYFRASGVMRQTFKNIVREELVSAMRGVKCPCLLVWGEKDFIVPVAIARRMIKEIRGSQLQVVPDADHGLPFKQPGVFAESTEAFLKSL